MFKFLGFLALAVLAFALVGCGSDTFTPRVFCDAGYIQAGEVCVPVCQEGWALDGEGLCACVIRSRRCQGDHDHRAATGECVCDMGFTCDRDHDECVQVRP